MAAATIIKKEVFKKDEEYFPLLTIKKATIISLMPSKICPALISRDKK